MKKWIGLFGVLLVGCQAHWVVTPAPSQSIDLPQAAVANGVLHPQELYFTLISQYQAAPRETVHSRNLAYGMVGTDGSSNTVHIGIKRFP